MGRDVLIGIDAGTSVMKAVAFSLSGEQLAMASRPNHYVLGPGGTATQSLAATWADCAATLNGLADRVENLRERVAALAVTGQGDGTWLIDGAGEPVIDGLLWLDARSNPEVRELRGTCADRRRFAITGTGLNACQMGPQLVHLKRRQGEAVAAAATAFHCKDWLYFKLTGERATDPSEGTFTFGDFRTRAYSDEVVEVFGLTGERRLLPPMLDGTKVQHPMTAEAARQTGLPEGTPVVLASLDVCCTGIGAGLFDPELLPGCSIIGSTGIHMRLTRQEDVVLGEEHTGYVVVLPVDGWCVQFQSNMAATLNIDWILRMAQGLLSDMGHESDDHRALIAHMDRWIEDGRPAELLYHPYISEAGERGPFVDGAARASFVGLSLRHGFADMVRAVVEGLGFAARDCYGGTGGAPREVRLTGGAARSATLRRILGAALDAPVRASLRDEAGAAGAAMLAAVGIGQYASMDDALAEWVAPLLKEAEPPDAELAGRYAALFPAYREARGALPPVWSKMARIAEVPHG